MKRVLAPSLLFSSGNRSPAAGNHGGVSGALPTQGRRPRCGEVDGCHKAWVFLF